MPLLFFVFIAWRKKTANRCTKGNGHIVFPHKCTNRKIPNYWVKSILGSTNSYYRKTKPLLAVSLFHNDLIHFS
ncbi:hypothetical protein A7K69_09060 [Parageobacillus thermoglucosidasius]|uniref:Uncharacterized protein n=1 Tax=Parageobacillus thermoglucosidasius TaxID=1426 RepID=A0A1B7KQB0_PARTM|nr:hypothetical protein A7K69_09060 [Parageobacillus thermoglucosidasius]